MLAATLAIVAMNVVGRYVFAHSVAWVEDWPSKLDAAIEAYRNT